MKNNVLFSIILVSTICILLASHCLYAVSIADYPSELPLLAAPQEPDEDNAYVITIAAQLEEAEIFRSKDYFHINLTSTFHVWAQTNKHTILPLWECLYTELNYYKAQNNVLQSMTQ